MVTVLKHHGIKGMHWGVRRYQNTDGSLTRAGKKRRADREIYIKDRQGNTEVNKNIINRVENAQKLSDKQYLQKNRKSINEIAKEYMEYEELSKQEAEKKVLQEFRDNDKKEKAQAKYQIDYNNKAIANIKNTPINKISVAEAEQRQSTIGIGSGIVGAASGVALSTILKKTGLISTGEAIGLGMLSVPVGFTVGTIVGTTKAGNHYRKKGIETRY